MQTTDAVIHCAASLNRKSEKACLNVNLRGTLEVIKLAAAARDHHGLRRFSHVSTVAVAGQRSNEVVREDDAIQWDRSDYDPYARTKKFCEHMIRELLPDVPRTIFRPSIVLGDSRHAETTQFDMVRAFVFLAGLPVLPFRADDKVDIVPGGLRRRRGGGAASEAAAGSRDLSSFLGHAVADLPRTDRGAESCAGKTASDLRCPVWRSPSRRWSTGFPTARERLGRAASLMKVFLPYLVWNTVFDNSRVVGELGVAPAPFSQYSYPLLKFSTENHFTYRYQEWPTATLPQQTKVEFAGTPAGGSLT